MTGARLEGESPDNWRTLRCRKTWMRGTSLAMTAAAAPYPIASPSGWIANCSSPASSASMAR